ncbi:MAG TPA: hypothetical protein VF529_22250 [Solirubrobacteraceae bacterium]|jgi:hypothetical protein
MRRLIIAAVACAGLLVAAPVASSDTAALTFNVVCTGKGYWQVDQLSSTAVVTTTSSTCKAANLTVDDDKDVHLDTGDGNYTGSYNVNLLAAGVWNANTFVATADRGAGPIGPVVATAGILNAELTPVNRFVPGVSSEIHRGTGSCGQHCYNVDITWTHLYDRMP